MATFKRGDSVKINTVIPSGPVLKLRMDDEGLVQCLVEWIDGDGVIQQRWFDEADLIAV
jgi:uncharacterized protein YodC (DUF2158 family)